MKTGERNPMLTSTTDLALALASIQTTNTATCAMAVQCNDNLNPLLSLSYLIHIYQIITQYIGLHMGKKCPQDLALFTTRDLDFLDFSDGFSNFA